MLPKMKVPAWLGANFGSGIRTNQQAAYGGRYNPTVQAPVMRPMGRPAWMVNTGAGGVERQIRHRNVGGDMQPVRPAWMNVNPIESTVRMLDRIMPKPRDGGGGRRSRPRGGV